MTAASEPRITIVGASLAGLRTAEAVIAALPEARITLVGDEPYRPYNRPPLSKDAAEALAGATANATETFEKLLLRTKLAPGQIEMRLGTAAEAIEGSDVLLADGTRLGSDWIVAASGLRPRRLPLTGAEDRRHVLRSFDDLQRLATAMRPQARMAVIGAGFIGCEIAATARKLGLDVCIVDPAPQPMLRVLVAPVAAAMGAFHRAHGVTLLTEKTVASFDGGSLVLDDGQTLEADVIVEAIGSWPNTEWLANSGADLSDGVLVDDRMIAIGTDNLLAVGDIARFANPLFDDVPRRVEHWCVPGQTAKRAADTIAALSKGMAPPDQFAPMPSFWSDQYGLRIQAFGAPALADTQTVVEGALDQIGQSPVIVEYARAGRLIGVLGLGANPATLAKYRGQLAAALSPSVTA